MKPAEISTLLSHFPIAPALLAELNRVLIEHEKFGVIRARLATLIERREQDGGGGFRNGWVSFPALRKLLINYDISCRDTDLAGHLVALGYVKHPGLPDGRTNNAVRPDNGKARLYIRPDHYSATLAGAAAIARAYQRDQGYAFTP